MPNTIPFKELQTSYASQFENLGWVTQAPTANTFLTRLCLLYLQLHVKKISHCTDDDMLLFQYGTQEYASQQCFYINLTRQLCQGYKMHQLSSTLLFAETELPDIASGNSWSNSQVSITEWVNHVQNMQGFIQAKTLTPLAFTWYLSNL